MPQQETQPRTFKRQIIVTLGIERKWILQRAKPFRVFFSIENTKYLLWNVTSLYLEWDNEPSLGWVIGKVMTQCLYLSHAFGYMGLLSHYKVLITLILRRFPSYFGSIVVLNYMCNTLHLEVLCSHNSPQCLSLGIQAVWLWVET